MITDWEMSHICYAVDNIDNWMDRFDEAMGGRWTKPLQVDAIWRTSLEGTETRHIQGRVRWLVGPSVPVELWEGPPGSPWNVPSGTMRFDHVCYWAFDMERQANQLGKLGFDLELTPQVSDGEPATDGPFRGFAYFRNAAGSRIELQRASDKPAMQRWMDGGELVLDYI
ncbi:VOC family protein [Sphingobium sp. 15-1]|uniref:VOC family protein n=1 Tax=Sphingobium sp. 15-1 TaxID=2729616 RepID=UPI00159CBFD7|nr:VOC family protein [Sphingobium sp. 15-1]